MLYSGVTTFVFYVWAPHTPTLCMAENVCITHEIPHPLSKTLDYASI